MVSSDVLPRKSSNVLKNLAILYGANMLTMFLSLLPIAFVPQYLDDIGVGRLTIAGSFGGIFGAVILMGTAPYIVREIARDRQQLADFVSGGVLLRTVLSVVLFPVLAVLLYLLRYPRDTQMIVLVTYIGLALGTIGQTLASGLQALEVMSWRSAATVLSKFVGVALGWLVLWQGGGLMGYVLVGLLATVVEVGVYVAYFATVDPLRFVLSRRMTMQIFRGGMPFFLWFFIQTIYQQTSTLMLSKMGTEQAVGWLGVGNQFMSPLFMIPSVVITVLLPQFSQLYVVGHDALRQSLTRAMHYLTIITVPLACGLAAVAPEVIALFNYPASFQHSIPVLQVLAFTLPGSSLLMVAATALAAMNMERSWARVSVFSLVLIVILTWVLIPLGQQFTGNAALGAAAAILLVEVFTCLWAFRLIGRTILDPKIFATMGKTLLAGTLMVAAVRALQGFSLLLMIPVGVAVYVCLALFLNVLPPEDLQALRTLVVSRSQSLAKTVQSLFIQERR